MSLSTPVTPLEVLVEPPRLGRELNATNPIKKVEASSSSNLRRCREIFGTPAGEGGCIL
jgi:hypothetical protein